VSHQRYPSRKWKNPWGARTLALTKRFVTYLPLRNGVTKVVRRADLVSQKRSFPYLPSSSEGSQVVVPEEPRARIVTVPKTLPFVTVM
jgi:hypothetical protein